MSTGSGSDRRSARSSWRRSLNRGTAVALLIFATAVPAAAAASPQQRLRAFLFDRYPRVAFSLTTDTSGGVRLTGGRVVVSEGAARLSDVTANVYLATTSEAAGRRACLAAAEGIRRLGLRQVSSLIVWGRVQTGTLRGSYNVTAEAPCE